MGVHLALQPKHRHLSHQLRQRLIVENRAPGDRFMTVREIARAYSVSLVTAHQSVQELANDNVLPALQEKFASSLGFTVEPGTPEALAKRTTAETARWANYVKIAKIEPQ